MRRQFFARLNFFVEKYRPVTNVAGTVLCAWLASAIVGQLISLFLPEPTAAVAPAYAHAPESFTAAAPPTSSVDFYLPVCERNIFDSQKRTICEEDSGEEGGVEETDMESAPVKSDIAATLLGTMVSTNPRRSFATISPKNGKETRNYRPCDEGEAGCELLLGEARIYEIQRNRIFFVRNNRREYLEVENLPSIYLAGTPAFESPSASEGVKLMGDRAVVTRAKVEATLGDLNTVIQQARMVPNYEGGAVNGFKVFAIRPASIFSELGLQNGDVIHRINGNDINSVEKAIPMLQLARNESRITIDLTRRGQKKTLAIDIQ